MNELARLHYDAAGTTASILSWLSGRPCTASEFHHNVIRIKSLTPSVWGSLAGLTECPSVSVN